MRRRKTAGKKPLKGRSWPVSAVRRSCREGQLRPGQISHLDQIAGQIISELNGSNVIALGPVVMGDGVTVPSFYCAICSNDDSGFFSLVCGAQDLDDAMRLRAMVRDRLRGLGRAVMGFDSALRMAREVEKL
jgi:hypothetical protein